MYNFSYHSILVIWLQIMNHSTRRETYHLGWRQDNVNPRVTIQEMEKSGKYEAETIKRLKRRQAAHLNGFEALPMYIAAVVLGNMAGLSSEWMNGVAVMFYLLRVVYFWLYVNISDVRYTLARSFVWWASNFLFITTIWRAGMALNAKGI